MGSHEPFGLLQHKLWQTERLGIKLAVWLPTTKSWELTWPRCVQVECDIVLESSRQELQVFFIFIPIGGLSKELWPHKVARVQTGTILGFPLKSPETKSHLDAAPVERRRVYYMGESGGFPRVRAMVSFVNPYSPMASLNAKGAPESELTHLLVGWMQIWVSNWKTCQSS
jgi:hypothetical protein